MIQKFLISGSKSSKALHSLEEITQWIDFLNKNTVVNLKPIALSQSSDWFYHQEEGQIRNKNLSFFQIKGVRGQVQLKYLEEDSVYRRHLVSCYEKMFEGNPHIRVIPSPPNSETSYHVFGIEVEKRDELVEFLAQKEVFAGVHYLDNTEYPMYAFGKGTCPYAHEVTKHILSLPLHLELTEEDVAYVGGLVLEFMNR